MLCFSTSLSVTNITSGIQEDSVMNTATFHSILLLLPSQNKADITSIQRIVPVSIYVVYSPILTNVPYSDAAAPPLHPARE